MMRFRSPRPVAALLLALLAACGGAPGSSTLPSSGSTAPLAYADAATATAAPYTCPSAQTSSGKLNCAALPLGDRKYSTHGPKAGYIYTCSTPSGSPVVASAPWLDAAAGTWDALAKTVVEGSVAWSGSYAEKDTSTTRDLDANLLPVAPHKTGIFPISSSDPAFKYDKNPNKIEAHTEDLSLPLEPAAAATPSCIGGGTIGVTVTGVAIYDGFDAAGYDAVAREEQDACHGHPDGSDTYHYHGWLQACVTDAGSATHNSSLLGYAIDGYGIYGPWYDGKVLTTADLDECHGTTSEVLWNGKLQSIYHYVSTYDFPYTIGCLHGKR